MILIYTLPKGPKSKKERFQRTKRAKVAHGKATNINMSTQAWHRAHKHIDLSIKWQRTYRHVDLGINMANNT